MGYTEPGPWQNIGDKNAGDIHAMHVSNTEEEKMKTKHVIQVREKRGYGDPGEVIAIIKRVLIAEQIGNFNPIFCRYRGKKCLVSSLAGDLSDPFRRDADYLKTLYIEEEK